MAEREERMRMLPAMIIARGGSKRIPRKNMRDFCGKPLVEWSIIQAQASKMASPVVLSTDDDEIARVGEKHGILVLRRPVMPDNTSGAVAFNMAIDQLRMRGYKFDAFISLLATGPLRLPDDIDSAIKLYWEYAYPVKTQLISGVRMGPSLGRPRKGSRIEYIPWAYKEDEEFMYDCGLISICDVKSYRKCLQKRDGQDLIDVRRRILKYHPWNVWYACKSWQWCDIDYPDEFELGELLFKHFILDKGYYQ